MEFSVARVLTAGHPEAPLGCEVLQAFSQVGAIIAAHGKGPSCSGNASIILIARTKESRQAQRDLVAVESKISRIVRAIEDGTASPTLTASQPFCLGSLGWDDNGGISLPLPTMPPTFDVCASHLEGKNRPA